MGGYIGPNKTLESRVEDNRVYLASAGQTSFACSYTVGYVDVFLNGTKLVPTTDFTATDGVNIVLTSAAALNDEVEVRGRIVSRAYDYYLKSQIDAKTVPYAVAVGSGDTMSVTMVPTIAALIDGMDYKVRVPSANAVTTPSITFSNLGISKTITKLGNLPLLAGDLTAGQEITVRYNSISDKLELISATPVPLQTSKIQSFTHSVSANASTATFAASVLDFRSATSSSGATIPSVSVPQLALTIPSGATLGTTASVLARLVYLVAYNGGTPVLCVTNIAGGLQLDETNLISPTTISSGATSINVIYSASAVSANSPYRVVGFIDITETTPGTWATDASLKQGIGGQALSALGSIGYSQTWQDVTGSRGSGTTYYNTSGRPITVKVQVSSWSASTDATITVNGLALASYDGAGVSGYQIPADFTVPVNGSYSVTAGNGISRWVELR